MTAPAGEHLFRSPGRHWPLWVLAVAAALGIVFGLVLRSTEMAFFFGICWLVPIVAAMLWRRSFVKAIRCLPDQRWQATTYSGVTHTFQKHDLLRGRVTRLGRLVYYILESRAHGRLRFVIADDAQERLLSSLLD